MAGTAGLLFILAACSNNSSSYPEEYVGFEKATKNYSFDKNNKAKLSFHTALRHLCTKLTWEKASDRMKQSGVVVPIIGDLDG